MVNSFSCTCGNKDTSKVHEYDGALGYEALVCKICGVYYDFDPDGKPRTNPPDEWSKKFIIKENVVKV